MELAGCSHLAMNPLRLREVEGLAQGHPAGKAGLGLQL